MLVFLIVILLLAALLESLSLRGGTSALRADFTLSESRTEVGVPVGLTTAVRNTGRLPISYCALSIGFPLSAELPDAPNILRERSLIRVGDVFRLWGRQSVERSMSFRMTRRGVFTFSGRELSRGDFLGLHLSTDRFDVRRTLLVYPPRLESDALTEALGSYSGELSAQRWLIRDPVLTMGVREYTGHEPMHTISWSQTARRGELTVREFDFTRSLNCCVIFNVSGLDAQDTELLDRCCGAVRTVCETLLAAGVEAQLYTNAALIGYPSRAYRFVSASPNREEDLLEVLARATATPSSTPDALASACLDAQTGAAAYVLVTPHADDTALRALDLLQARSGLGVLLVAVDQLGGDAS